MKENCFPFSLKNDTFQFKGEVRFLNLPLISFSVLADNFKGTEFP